MFRLLLRLLLLVLLLYFIFCFVKYTACFPFTFDTHHSSTNFFANRNWLNLVVSLLIARFVRASFASCVQVLRSSCKFSTDLSKLIMRFFYFSRSLSRSRSLYTVSKPLLLFRMFCFLICLLGGLLRMLFFPFILLVHIRCRWDMSENVRNCLCAEKHFILPDFRGRSSNTSHGICGVHTKTFTHVHKCAFLCHVFLMLPFFRSSSLKQK